MNINIYHLYPALLNLYGDKGNINVLEKRCLWRGISVSIKEISHNEDFSLDDCDILLIGGGSDEAQTKVSSLLSNHKEIIKNYIENGGVALCLCGGFYLMGKDYKTPKGKVAGLEILDIDTVFNEKRHIGNVVINCTIGEKQFTVAGFENHGEEVVINNHIPLGTIEYGFGNDKKYEGVIYKNLFASNLHGPLLPKSPSLADEIIFRALSKKYNTNVELEQLNDEIEQLALDNIVLKLKNQ